MNHQNLRQNSIPVRCEHTSHSLGEKTARLLGWVTFFELMWLSVLINGQQPLGIAGDLLLATLAGIVLALFMQVTGDAIPLSNNAPEDVDNLKRFLDEAQWHGIELPPLPQTDPGKVTHGELRQWCKKANNALREQYWQLKHKELKTAAS